jgi:hypothetical protein
MEAAVVFVILVFLISPIVWLFWIGISGGADKWERLASEEEVAKEVKAEEAFRTVEIPSEIEIEESISEGEITEAENNTSSKPLIISYVVTLACMLLHVASNKPIDYGEVVAAFFCAAMCAPIVYLIFRIVFSRFGLAVGLICLGVYILSNVHISGSALIFIAILIIYNDMDRRLSRIERERNE